MTIKNPILLEAPMPIWTPRLQIRPRQVGEGAIVARAVNESLEHLRPWMPFAQEPAEDEDSEIRCRKALARFIERTDFTLSIYDREGRTFIGSCGLHRPNWDVPSFHLGYWVHKDFVGQGYISEASNALTRYAFEVLGARRVEIRCDRPNARSLAVMLKLGYVQEAILRNEARSIDGSLTDTILTARYDLEGLPALDVSW